MSYLLMQILICLLIAGLIGMIIGWLLRGDCKKALKDNDNQWESKLIDTNNAWEQKVQALISEHQKDIEESDFKIVNLRETINKANDRVSILEQKLSEANSNLAKAKTTIMTKDDETKRLRMKIDSLGRELEITKKELESARDSHQSEIKEWQFKLDKANQEYKQEAQSLLGNSQSKIDSLEQEISNYQEKIKASQSKIETLLRELEDTKKAYELTKKELHSVQNKLSQKEAESKEPMLIQQIASLEQELTKAKDKISQLSNEKESLEERLRLLDSENEFNIINSLYEWKSKYKVAKEQLDECQSKQSDISTLSTSKSQLLLSSTTSTQSEEQEIETSKPALLTEAKNGKKDNLTLVKGIGKVLEERLNNLGIFHFEQIASWTKAEQAWIDKYMSFPGRVEREEWVKQAKKLLKGIETEFAKRVKSGDVPTSKTD